MRNIGKRRRLARRGLCMAAVLTMLLCAAAVQTAGSVDNSAQASCVNIFDAGEAQETTTVPETTTGEPTTAEPEATTAPETTAEPETPVPGGDIPATGGAAVLIGLALVSVGASSAVLVLTRGGKHKDRRA